MIILSIPYFGQQSIINNPDPGTDWVEYRLDCCNHLPYLEFYIYPTNAIFTVRDINEGGFLYVEPAEKQAILQKILLQTDCLLDVEYAFLKLNPEFHIKSERLMLSLHTDLTHRELIDEFIHTDYPAAHYKLAVSCDNIGQLDDIITQIPPDRKAHFSLIPLPPCSCSARLYYRLYSSEFTYVYHVSPLISNQISLRIALTCRIKSMNAETEVYAIIGHKQVLEALSVRVYNQWFVQNEQNKVFLPIVAETLADAIAQINWLQQRVNVQGISVTMPYKQELAAWLQAQEAIINTWLPNRNITANTDKSAMITALDTLRIQENSKILVLGTGAMAKLAINLLSNRNAIIFQINRAYDIKQIIDSVSVHKKEKQPDRYDLLINCTPFGTSPEDDPDALPDFAALIDLPYGDAPTTLVEKAKKNNLPYTEGFQFWVWQAEEQVRLFGFDPSLLASIAIS